MRCDYCNTEVDFATVEEFQIEPEQAQLHTVCMECLNNEPKKVWTLIDFCNKAMQKNPKIMAEYVLGHIQAPN